MLSKAQRLALKVTGTYVLVSACWILFSDELVGGFVTSPEDRIRYSIIKGWGFVLLTGGVLYQILTRLLGNGEREAEQRRQAESQWHEAAESLKKGQERQQMILEASTDGLWDWNLKTGAIYLSPRYCELTGCSASEVVANLEFFQRLVHPEDWPAVQAAMNEQLAGKSAHSVSEYRLITKVGTEKWMLGRDKVVARAADGAPLRMVGTVSDITERKRIEGKLRQSEADLAEGQRVAKLGSWRYDIASNQVRWSDELGRIFGIEKAAFSGTYEAFLNYVHPDDRARVLQANTDAKAAGNSFEVEYRIQTAAGELKTIRETGYAVKDAGGKVASLFGTAQDITGRKNDEAALRLSDFSVNHVSLSTFWITREGRIVRVNQAACAKLGYTESELLQLGIPDLDPDFPAERWPVHWQELRERKHLSFETRHRRKDGQVFPVEVELNWFEFNGQEYNFAFARDITERIRSQTNLQESEEKFRQLAENITDVFWICSPDFKTMHFVSPAFEKIWGRSREGLYMHPHQWVEAIVPEERERVFAEFSALAGNKAELSIEYRITRPDGSVRWIHDHGFQVRDEAGQLIRITGIASDITSRKQAETELRQSQERYVLAECAVNDGLWDWNILTNDEYFSPRWKQIIGYEDGELPNNKAAFLKLIHPDDRMQVDVATRSHLELGRPYSLEYRLRHKDGGYRWVFSRGQALRDAAGRPFRMFGAVTDITDRKRSEESLHASEHLLRTVMDLVPHSIFVKDSQSRHVLANRACAAANGMTPEAMIGKCDLDFVPDREQAEAFMRHDREVIESNQTKFVAEERLTNAAGETRILQTIKIPFANPAGGGPALMGVSVDITALKEAETARRRSEGTLLAALASMTDAVFISDNEGNFIEFNEAFATFHRFKNKAECARKLADYPGVFEVFTPEGKPVPLEMWPVCRSLRGETATNAEYTIRRKDTDETWVGSYSFSPIRDQAGRIAGAVVLIRDITAAKQTEAKLLKLSRVVEQCPSAVVITDVNGAIEYVNEAFTLSTGYTFGEVLGRNLRLLKSGKTPDKTYKSLWGTVTAGQTWKGELHNRKKSGELYWEWNTISPLVGRDNEITHYIAIKEDITARKRIEAALRLSEFTIGHSSQPMFWAGPDGRIIRVNAAGCRHLGYTEAELLQLRVHDLDPDHPAARWPEHWQELRQCNQMSFETKHRHKDGRLIPVEMELNWMEFDGQEYIFAFARDITAPKQAAAALQLSHSLLNASLESTADGIMVVDLHGKVTHCNQKFLKLWRIPRSLAMLRDDQKILEFVLAQLENPAAFLARVNELYQNPETSSLEEVKFMDGRVYERYSQPQRIDDNVVGRVWSFRDITDRKRTEAALRESENLLRQVLENVPLPLCHTTKDGVIVFRNARFGQIIGYTKQEVPDVATWWLRAYPDPHYRQWVIETWDAAVRRASETGRDIEPIEYRVTCKDGQERPIEISGMPLGDGLVVTFLDLTERKQKEEELRWKSAFLESLVHSSSDGILVVDSLGKKILQNQKMAELWKIPAEIFHNPNDRLQNDFAMSQTKDPADFARKSRRINLRPDEAAYDEIELKDGTLLDRQTFLVKNDQGKSFGRVWTYRDITKQCQLEAQLRQSQKMEAVGTLAGGIAHDFNNMLGVIFGYTSLLQQDVAGNPDAQECVAEILKASHRAKDLVQQILTFSRQREQKRQVMWLGSVIKEVTKFLRTSLPAGIRMDVQLEPDSPTVLADPTQIHQIVMNLATNSLHAMGGQAGTLSVRLDTFAADAAYAQSHAGFREQKYARLRVSDTGSGMDARTLERIFDPFFTTKPVGQGTGLGLAVVHGIVQSHEGMIEVQSQPGLGTTFSLYFPAHIEDEATVETSLQTIRRGNGERILVLDDEAALTHAFERILGRLNYQIILRNNPRAAVELVRSDPTQFDLVLTDFAMPELNGLDVARLIHDLRSDLPIIVMSGFMTNVTEAELRDAGVQQLLEKPISFATLAETLHLTLTNQKNGNYENDHAGG